VSGNTIEVALKEQETDVLALVNELAKRGRVLRVEVSGASLEDIFVELTQRPAEIGDRAMKQLLAVLHREGKIRATNLTFIFWDVFYPLAYLMVFGVAMQRAMGFTSRESASTITRSSSPACSRWRASRSPRTPRGRSSWIAITASSTRCSPTR
jgi:hypothetical protein